MRWLALLVAIALAGCATDAPDAEPDLPTTLAWGLQDCRAVIAIVPANADDVAPFLPEGFTAMSMEDLVGTESNFRAEANFGIEMLTCASGAGLDGPIEGIHYGGYFIGVHPPEELRENVTFHFTKYDVLIPDEPRRTMLLDAGIPAVDGSASFSRFLGLGANRAYEGTLMMDGASHTFLGTTQAPDEPQGSFVEFTDTGLALASWHANYTWSEVGIGPVSVGVAADTLAAQIVGPGLVGGVAFAGIVTFDPASITLP